jgi:hypothetical protein
VEIFRGLESWANTCWPNTIADYQISEIPEDELANWNDKARQVAITGYHLALEDRRDLSDPSEEWSPEGDEGPNMYLPGASISTVRLRVFEAFLA